MTKELTRNSFNESTKHCKSLFEESKYFNKDIYIIEFGNSFLKAAIQKTDEGVQIIYLDSYYDTNADKVKLIGYATFVIAYRINGNKGFETVEIHSA